MKRKCPMCLEYKDSSVFYRNPKTGLYNAYCYDCRKFYNRQYKHIRTARLKDKNNPIIK